MGKLNQVLQGHRVIALDTNCFICYLEAGAWAEELKSALFAPLERGKFRAVTSVLTVAEILVRPKTLGREEVCEEYLMLLSSYLNLELAPFTLDIAVRCAGIRSKYRMRTPDAVQLATALERRATLFLTNDLELPERVETVQVAFLRDLLPPPPPGSHSMG